MAAIQKVSISSKESDSIEVPFIFAAVSIYLKRLINFLLVRSKADSGLIFKIVNNLLLKKARHQIQLQ